MGYWQGIRYIITNTIVNARWKNLFFVIYMLYMGFIVGSLALDRMKEVELFPVDQFMLNIFVLIIFSYSGMFSNYNYGLNFNQDLLGERLIYLRTLPIKINQIIWSKIILNAMFCILSVFSFYLLVFGLGYAYEIELKISGLFINFVAISAVTLIINMILLYIEMNYSFKRYTFISFSTPILYIILIILLGYYFEFFLVDWINSQVEAIPILVLIISVIIMIITVIITYYAINKRFRKRNLT